MTQTLERMAGPPCKILLLANSATAPEVHTFEALVLKLMNNGTPRNQAINDAREGAPYLHERWLQRGCPPIPTALLANSSPGLDFATLVRRNIASGLTRNRAVLKTIAEHPDKHAEWLRRGDGSL